MDRAPTTDAKARKPSKAGKEGAPLATPTDLKANDVKEVSDALNGILADSLVLYLKTKNFHWHICGPNFRDYHVLFDEQAEQIFGSVDQLAERVRKIGGKTIHSFNEVLRRKSLEENDADFVSADQMLLELLEDNRACAEAMRKAHKVCDDAEDVASASLLENFIDETERRIWFLFETSRAPDASGH